ncbi:hypothetical protein ACWGQ5_44790, partial [Streptomyces sp. NPDC055722]
MSGRIGYGAGLRAERGPWLLSVLTVVCGGVTAMYYWNHRGMNGWGWFVGSVSAILFLKLLVLLVVLLDRTMNRRLRALARPHVSSPEQVLAERFALGRSTRKSTGADWRYCETNARALRNADRRGDRSACQCGGPVKARCHQARRRRRCTVITRLRMPHRHLTPPAKSGPPREPP